MQGHDGLKCSKCYDRKARIAPSELPNDAINAKGRNRGKLEMLLSPRKNGQDSLFKEVRLFKGSSFAFGIENIHKRE